MAGSQHTQTRPEFTWRFLSTSERYPTAKPLVIYVKDTYIEYWGEIFVSARIIEFGITFERFLKDPWKHLMSCGQESAPDSIAEGMLPLLPARQKLLGVFERMNCVSWHSSVSFYQGLTLSGTKTHVKQRFLPLTPLLMVSDVLWSPVLPA